MKRLILSELRSREFWLELAVSVAFCAVLAALMLSVDSRL